MYTVLVGTTKKLKDYFAFAFARWAAFGRSEIQSFCIRENENASTVCSTARKKKKKEEFKMYEVHGHAKKNIKTMSSMTSSAICKPNF